MPETDLAAQLVQAARAFLHTYDDYSFSEFFKGEAKILNYLYEHQNTGFVTPSVVCRALRFTSPRMTAALKNLEKKGYILKVKSLSDRRSSTIALSDTGRDWIIEKRTEILLHTNRIVNKIGTENARTLISILCLAAENEERDS